MKTYQAYCDFTAQGRTVSCLLGLFSNLENSDIKALELPTVVFMAFSIESYINSIGFRFLDNWSEIERKNWKDKIDILHEKSGKESNWSKGDLQFANEIFSIRDKLAHGKPESVKGKLTNNREIAKIQNESNELQPDWYKKINKQWLLDSKSKYQKLMFYLASLYSLNESDYLNMAEGAIRTTERFRLTK